MPQHDDHDHLAASGFDADESAEHGGAKSDAWDFPVAADDSGQELTFDALGEYTPTESEETGTELDAIDSLTKDAEDEDEEDAVQLFEVTNPPQTVKVSALIDGGIQRVALSAVVTSMSESDLADEILALADLARQKGLAGQYTLLSEGMSEMGEDDREALCDFLEVGMDLSTPEQAAAAQAEVFATRYGTDE
jgi:hypothetical protein